MDTELFTNKAIKGLKNPKLAFDYLSAPVRKGVPLTLSSWLPIGVNVFERDWDLLIVLDTCRPDALIAVADEYAFLSADEITTTTSVGTSTLEWTAATFTREHTDKIANTAMISANGWPHRILDKGYRPEERHRAGMLPTKWDTVSGDELGKHVPAWQFGEGRAGWSNQPQADAETVSDLAIGIGRNDDFDRVIAHFIEPHYPFAAAAMQRGARELSQSEQSPWEYIDETGDEDTVWDHYLTELRFGLDSVERLLDNFDAEKVLITADHAECFGEWRRYGHTSASMNPALRTVPLAWTSGADSKSYTPPEYTEENNRSVEQNLESLGYI